MLYLNNAAGQRLDLENDTLPSKRLLSQSSHTEIVSCILPLWKWAMLLKIYFAARKSDSWFIVSNSC